MVTQDWWGLGGRLPSDAQDGMSVCKCGGEGIVHFVLKFCLALCQKVNFSVVEEQRTVLGRV